MTNEEYKAFRTGRKAAAAKVDIETCEYWRTYVDVADVYGLLDKDVQTTKAYFVSTPESDGRIADEDLSDAQFDALLKRASRETDSRQREMDEALRAAGAAALRACGIG
jgi:hypothetical protein